MPSQEPSRQKTSSPFALESAALAFSYPDRRPVLQNVNYSIKPGERVGLIGPNGAGKTTLFMLGCGVLKPTAGEVRLFGKPVLPGSFHPEVGMVFQNQDDQLFCPSVRDDIAFGPRNLGLSDAEVAERVREAFAVTGISELAERPPHHLSGGEKRLVAIAGVLAMRPKLIIYDEPTSNLDIRYRRRLINFLQNARETLLIASHDLEFILEVCTRVLLLYEGTIKSDGNAYDILGNVALMEEHGLERPHSLVPHTEPHHQNRGAGLG